MTNHMEKPLRVTLVISRLNRGGTEVQLLELAKALDPKKFILSLLVFYPGNQMEEEARKILPLKYLPLAKKSRWDFLFFLRFIQILRKEKPDVIYSFLPAANLVSLLARPFLMGTKLVWGIRASNMDFSRFDAFSKMIWKMECWLTRLTTLTIANSQAGKKHSILNGAKASRITVIPNGIDTDRFEPDEENRQVIREQLSVTGEEWLIGIVGRFDPMKDHATFLKAAERVAQKRENVKFLLVGLTDSEALSLLPDSALREKLICTGPVSDTAFYFKALDLYCSSSVSEGFSNSIAEAMSSGVPCVVTDVGDSKEIVGETGWVVPPKKPEELAEGILIQLSRLELAQAEMSQASRERIRRFYSREKLGINVSTALTGLFPTGAARSWKASQEFPGA